MPFDNSSTGGKHPHGPMCRCGHRQLFHADVLLCEYTTCAMPRCVCAAFQAPEAEGDDQSDPMCRCSHGRNAHFGVASPVCCETGCACQKFQAPEAPTDPPKAEEVCRCGHRQGLHVNKSGRTPGYCARSGCGCVGFQAPEAPVDPPKAEEKGHDFVGPDHCDECDRAWAMRMQQSGMIPRRSEMAEAYPAPERRPPYSVAYAVDGGHEYEIAVPGDAMVIAEDGVLKILHYCRPVAGIVQIKPMREGGA